MPFPRVSAVRGRTTAAVLLTAAVAAGLLGAVAVAGTANDPGFGNQWGLQAVRAPEAWDVATGRGVTIAIVDTGIDASHPDLAAKVRPGASFVTGVSSTHDGNSHGTHVAGIAAAVTNNGIGMAGAAPDASLLPVKVLDDAGDGDGSAVDRGIRYATDAGAKVINLSLGSDLQGVTGASFLGACEYAWSKGSLCVIASGNSYIFGSGIAGTHAVVVSATNRSGGKPAYSSGVGDAMWGLAAPGGGDSLLSQEGIYSTLPNARYGFKSGTSMSAPHVSGAAALLFELGLTAQQVVDRLLSTAKDIGPAGRDGTFGSGLLDMAAAVAGLSRPVATSPTTTTTTTTPGTTTTTTPGSTTTTTTPSSGSPTTTAPTTTAPPASDTAERLEGADRIDTAVAISRHAYPDRAGAAVLSRADSFADALAGTPLAARLDAPLLLTGSGGLDGRTRGEIQRVVPAGGSVHLLGGTAALNSAVDTELRDLGYRVVRYAGSDRFDTAVRIAADGMGNPPSFLLATGLDFHDALMAGAAAPRVDGAVLLTFGTSLPKATADYLGSRPGARRYAVGGAAAQADRSATAFVGPDPVVTSRRVAEALFGSPGSAVLASRAAFPDALGGGALAAKKGAPLLFSDPVTLSQPVAEYLAARRQALTHAYVLGGQAALSEDVRRSAEAAIR